MHCNYSGTHMMMMMIRPSSLPAVAKIKGTTAVWLLAAVLSSLYGARQGLVLLSAASSHSSRSAASLPPMEPFSFADGRPWNDINLEKNATCGGRKCFFASVSSPHTVGYLISDPSNFHRMLVSTRLAHELQADFGTRHVFTQGGPALTTIDASLAARLVRRVHRPMASVLSNWHPPPFLQQFNDQRGATGGLGDGSNTTATTISVAVQAVAVVPPPALWIGLAQGNYHLLMTQRAPAFWDALQALGGADYRAALGRQFAAEIRQLNRILARHPHLYFDFQGIVSGRTGHFYHADLDGHVGKEHWRNTTQVAQQIAKQQRRLWYLHGYLMHDHKRSGGEDQIQNNASSWHVP